MSYSHVFPTVKPQFFMANLHPFPYWANHMLKLLKPTSPKAISIRDFTTEITDEQRLEKLLQAPSEW